MAEKKFYYTYTAPNGERRGLYANSKYEALYTASCIHNQIIPSKDMRKADPMNALVEAAKAQGRASWGYKMNPSPATLAYHRSKMNAKT